MSTYPLDALPDERLHNALAMLRRLSAESAADVEAPLDSPDGVAIVDLLRAGRIEFAGGDASTIRVRVKARCAV